MNDPLLAKSVFGELTLGEVWEHVSNISEIDVFIQEPDSRRMYCFRMWDDSNERLNLYIDDMGNDPDPEFSLKFSSKVRIVENCVLIRWLGADMKLMFFRRAAVDLSRFMPSPEKPSRVGS